MIRNSRRVVALAIAGAVAGAPVISGCGAGSEPQTAAPTQLTEGVNVSVPKDKPASAQIDIRNMFLLGPQPGMTFGSGSSVPLYATIINQVKGRQDRLVSVSSPAFSGVKIAGGGIVLPPAKPSGEGSAVKLVGQAAPSAGPSAAASKKPGATPSGGGATVGATPSGQGASGGGTPQPTGTGATSGVTVSPTSGTTSAPAGSAGPAAPATGEIPLVLLTGLGRELIGGEVLQVRLQFEQAGSVDASVPVIPQQGDYTTWPPGTPAPGASPSTLPTAGPTGSPSTSETPGGSPTSGGASSSPGTAPATPAASESPKPGSGH